MLVSIIYVPKYLNLIYTYGFVDNILMYYRAFQIHIPAKGGKTKKILVNEDQSKETNLLEDSFKDADRRKYKQ